MKRLLVQMLSGYSRFRHVYGSAASRDQCYDGVRVSTGGGQDASLCAVNRRFLAIVVQSSGGGVFVVIPLHMVRFNGVARGGQGGQSTSIPLRKKLQGKKQLHLFTTFTLHIELHSERQWRRNTLKSSDLTPVALIQLLTDLPPLQHGDLTF